MRLRLRSRTAGGAQGYAAPLVHTFGNPMSIRLTDEGAALALRLHRAAESRGDCRCGLAPQLRLGGACAPLADACVSVISTRSRARARPGRAAACARLRRVGVGGDGTCG